LYRARTASVGESAARTPFEALGALFASVPGASSALVFARLLMSRRHSLAARSLAPFRGLAAAAGPLVLAVGVALLMGAALAGCDTAGSSSGNVVITGRVTDGNGNAVENARLEVTVPGEEGDENMYTAHTDTSGSYRLELDVPSGMEVTVEVFSDEKSSEKVLTVLPEEDRSNVNFVLGGSAENSGTALLEGNVLDGNGDPVASAQVAALPNEQTVSDQEISTSTDGDGAYALEVEITAGTDLTVQASSDGRDAEQVVTVFPDSARSGIDFSFEGDDDEEGGQPAYIELQSVDPQTIQVQETGGTEVSRLTFVVRDEAGQAISLDEQRQMRFRFGNKPPLLPPNQEELEESEDSLKILPKQALTNDNGEATVNVNSGLVAGVAQVIAEVDGPNGQAIESEPVPITIHGGFPSREHLTVAVDQFNYAGLSVAGLENEVSVLVGDRYSNPVRPETAVYFETTGGVVEGDVLTDEQGRGAVQLISGNPEPEETENGNGGPGVAVVTARTVNVDNEAITRKAAVVVSGVPNLAVTSDDGDAKQAQLGQSYTLKVVDQNENPLAPGTSIQVRAEGNEVEVGGADATAGDVNVTLENTPLVDQDGDGDALDYEDVQRGVGRTAFSFKPIEDPNPEEEGQPTLTGLTITVNGPGGSASCSIDTSPGQTTCSTGSITSSADGGRLVVEGEEPKR
jgi:hypothetical protein